MDQHLLKLRRPPQGFTLIELIVVVAILALLLTVAGTQTTGSLETMQMKEAIETTRYSMEHARQVAMTSNTAVMVRFYDEPDEFGERRWRSIEFGQAETITDPSDPDYQSPSDSSYKRKFKRIGTVDRLPSGYVYHSSATFSSLLSSSEGVERGTEDAPSGGTRDFAGFYYLPDGSSSLPAGNNWTLTIVRDREVASGALPPNYATLQLNPRTARVRTYRP
jgi:uncharacterized protein (TIGR02596 family)